MKARNVVGLGALLIVAACGGPGDGDHALVAADVADATFIGAASGDHLAAAVTGDFNGDGAADLGLSATGGDGPDENRTDAGEVHILFGADELRGIVDLAAEIPGQSVYFGPHSGSSFGRALSVGDYNTDGIDDLAISAPLGIDPASGIDSEGLVYVFLGSADITGRTTDIARETADISIRGADPGDGAGLSLLTADFDGDGSDDLLVGAHLADGPDNQRPDAGEAYFLPGPSLLPEMSLPRDAAATLIGAKMGDHLSETIAQGDFNRDEVADLVIAATFADDGGQLDSGLTYAWLSPLTGTVDFAVSEPALTIGGGDAGDQMGHSIRVGDADNSGFVDLWLGSVSADGPGDDEDLAGEVHVFQVSLINSGDNQPTLRLTANDAEGAMFGPEAKARLGRNATMAQLDGERGQDFAIAATDVLDRAGEVYILFDGQDIPGRADSAGVIYLGAGPDDILGHEAFGIPSLSGIDLDGDGLDELLVAAPGNDGPGNRPDSGVVYLLPEIVKG